MYKVQLYIENKRADLFNDENIEVSSSVQNISDISKVFTDFSKSFTIPASDVNNDILKYYYNNDLDEFNANVRVPARIEIDLNRFREGQIQLEGSIIKGGQVEAYNVTFYGDVVTLKDLFGDEKLQDLDYTAINEAYTGANVLNSLTDTSDLDVRFPLISSSRVWTYNDAAATDIKTSGGAIDFTELFPAVKDKKILELIENKYGVTFEGIFLDDERFTQKFTYWKNRETSDFTTEPVDITFNPSATPAATFDTYLVTGVNSVILQRLESQNFTNVPGNYVSFFNNNVAQHEFVKVYINPTTADPYLLDTYKNGILFSTISGSGTNEYYPLISIGNTSGMNDEYTFKVRATGSGITFDAEVHYRFRYYYLKLGGLITSDVKQVLLGSVTGLVISNVMDFASSAPDIKIEDWLKDTLKEQNLTCVPTEDDLTYVIEPLEDWYSQGTNIDITPYVGTNEIKVDRAKLYSEISFEYAKSKSFLNEAYLEFNNLAYGDLKEIFNYDGGKYEIKVAFENLLFQKFTGVNLQVGYCLTKAPDYKPYIPKPIKLYLRDSVSCDFYFDNGAGPAQVVTYLPFGSDFVYNSETYSNNFGEENSTFLEVPVVNSYYKEYYQPYLVNLFNSKTRIVTVKCQFPLSLLTGIKLNDAIHIRDKKYRINTMKSELTNGMVTLVLISDFVGEHSPIIIPDITKVPPTKPFIFPIRPPSGGTIEVDAPIETPFVTGSPTLPHTATTSKNVTLTIATNGTGANRTNTIIYRAYDGSGVLQSTRTLIITQLGGDGFLLQENGSYILQENLDKIIVP
jgi:hypothetical protein